MADGYENVELGMMHNLNVASCVTVWVYVCPIHWRRWGNLGWRAAKSHVSENIFWPGA